MLTLLTLLVDLFSSCEQVQSHTYHPTHSPLEVPQNANSGPRENFTQSCAKPNAKHKLVREKNQAADSTERDMAKLNL